MAGKCCHSKPICKNCPRRKKGKKDKHVGAARGDPGKTCAEHIIRLATARSAER